MPNHHQSTVTLRYHEDANPKLSSAFISDYQSGHSEHQATIENVRMQLRLRAGQIIGKSIHI